jgi:hypothetical protein
VQKILGVVGDNAAWNEAQLNRVTRLIRLKMLKRQMFGRARLDRLTRRVLLVA